MAIITKDDYVRYMKGNVGIPVDKIAHLPHLLQYNTDGDHALNGNEFAGVFDELARLAGAVSAQAIDTGSATAPTEAGKLYRTLRSFAVPTPGTDEPLGERTLAAVLPQVAKGFVTLGFMPGGQARKGVALLQEALNILGEENPHYLVGTPDGAFGHKTRLAIEAFQRQYGLEQDGRVGAETLAQLDLILAGARADGPTPSVVPPPPLSVPAESDLICDITYNDAFVHNGQAHVSLTFDDGPDPDTARLLDLLRDLGLTGCTFFCQGQNGPAYPALARRIVAAGHTIANYSWDHAHLKPHGRDLTVAAIRSQIQRTQDVIAAVTGLRPTLFRPPYGALGPAGRAVCHERGVSATWWDGDSDDWKHRNDSAEIMDDLFADAGSLSTDTYAPSFHGGAHYVHESTTSLCALSAPTLQPGGCTGCAQCPGRCQCYGGVAVTGLPCLAVSSSHIAGRANSAGPGSHLR